MDRMEEIRDYMSGKKKGSFADYFKRKKIEKALATTKKKEAKEIQLMQDLLHKYFDLQGLDMSKSDIAKVHKYIQETMVLDDEYEVSRYLTMIDNFSNLNGGMEAFAKDRERTIERMNNGEIVSKADACVAAKNVIVFLKEIVSYHYNDNEEVRHLIRPRNTYQVTVNPEAKQPVSKQPFQSEMDRIVKTFETVKTSAFLSPISTK